MPENNFEIKVQQQMEGFRLKPAASVWKEVEERIRRKRRRRIIFWWFIPALLLGSGVAVAYLFYAGASQKQNKTAAYTKPADNKPGTVSETDMRKEADNILTQTKNGIPANSSTPASGEPKPATVTPAATPNTTDRINIAAKPGDAPLATAATKKKNNRLTAISGQSNQQLKIKTNRDTEPATAQHLPGGDLPVAKTTDQLHIVPAGDETVATTMQAIPVSKDEVTDPNLPDSLHNDKPVVPTAQADGLIADKEQEPVTDNSTPLRVHHKKKGSWEISAGKGISVESDGIFSVNKAERFYAASAGSPTVLPLNLEAGNAFSFQVNRRIPLKKRLDIIAGISYDYYSTRQWVGAYMEASRQFPAVGGGPGSVHNGPYYSLPYIGITYNQFKNRYHLAGISGGLVWKWAERKNFSIGWRNSINLQYLIGAHALQFDASIPGYALSNTGLNRLQPGFTTGIDLLLFRKILVRPYHTLQLSHMSKYNSNYINATGIHIGILFNRK